MGLYAYTLRSESRVIDGVEIAYYGYAYKLGSDHHADSRIPSVRLSIRSMYSRAEDAAWKHAGVRHFIHGKFTDITDREPAAVFLTEKVIDSYVEELPGAIVVGHLHREGRKLRFVPKAL